MKALEIAQNKSFIGRKQEWDRLKALGQQQEATLLVVYGRRRVGKTELIEQVYRQSHLLKFEGIARKKPQQQRNHVLWQLARYTGNELLNKVQLTSWLEVFKLLFDSLPEGQWTLYFEEVQWLADYQDDFIAELKFAWDNYFRHKKKLLLILCGSAPSFIINHVLLSKALYNRSQHELHLREFNLSELRAFMRDHSSREIMDTYLSVGGIPEYIKYCQQGSSTFLGLCQHAFLPDGFFTKEHQRIFVSSLASNKHYREIIEYLAKKSFASRKEILTHLKIQSSGSLTEVMEDLELCGFVERYTPYHLKPGSLLTRYRIADNYLRFYYKFIKPIDADIQSGRYQDNPSQAINLDTYNKWLGYAFERFCCQQHHLIAKILGFHGIKYRAGSFFNHSGEKAIPNYQCDLVFDRSDKVITICEVKYLQSVVTSRVIEEFERKLEYFPNKQKKTLQKILITASDVSEEVKKRHYFDRIIRLGDLFNI